jgi:hypothetical protein
MLMQTHTVLNYFPELKLAVVDDESTNPFTEVHVAAFITGYARIKLHKFIKIVEEKNGTVYYVDTDCLVTNVEMTTGKNLGDLTCEADDIEEGIFLFPKFYAYRRKNGEEVHRAKGFNAKDFSFSDFRDALSGKTSQFTQTRDGMAGLLEASRRSLDHLAVINRTRKIVGIFDKRTLDPLTQETTAKEI